MGSIRAWLLGIGLCCLCALLWAQDPPVPAKPQQLVNDYAAVLSPGNAAALERKLVAYDDSTGTQIAIAIERELESGAVFDRSLAIAEAWGIGGKQDNGVLIYIALDNRKIFIQNGYGVEDRLTDALTSIIINQVIVPNFRAGRYYIGLDRATSIMIDALAGRYTADPEEVGRGGGLSSFEVIFIFLVIFFLIRWLTSRRGGDDEDGGYHRGGRYRGPRRRGGWVIMPGGGFGGGGFGGGGFGGGGGGGFGGFGGGTFGGGGAGGSW